jgi:DNA-binding winged helix-turn-helix (wHTH) protein
MHRFKGQSPAQWRPPVDFLYISCTGNSGVFRYLGDSRLGCDLESRAWRDPAPRGVIVEVFRFESFEVDRGAFELRRAGRPVPIERIPMELLLLLLERHGQLVTRQEILDRIWGKNVFVDVDNSINTAVRKVRQALRDNPASPRLLHTVPGKGYRIAVVTVDRQGTSESIVPPSLKETKEEESRNVQAGVATAEAAAVSSPSATLPAPPRSAKWVPLGWIGGALIVLAGLAASWVIAHYPGAKPAGRTSSASASAAIHSLAVLPLENLSGDKEQEYFATG